MKMDIIDRLISDFEIRASKSWIEMAKEKGLNVEYDSRAAMFLLRLISHLTYVYCEIAKEGNEAFAGELSIYAAEMVRTLNGIAWKHPEQVRSCAAGMVEWPIMATRHFPKKSDLAKLADQIGLASGTPVKPQPRHTWRPDTPLNRYILDMLVNERWGDGRTLKQEDVPYYLDEILMPLFERVANEEGGWENYDEFAAIARSAAKRGKTGVQRSEIRSRVKKVLESLAC
jgi:hypothetical protein